MMEWRSDMENAPQDGTVVDLWVEGAVSAFRLTDCLYGRSDWARVSDPAQWVVAVRDDAEPHRDCVVDVAYRWQDCRITHWMQIHPPAQP